MNGEIMDVVTSFKYLRCCSSNDGGLQEDVKMKVGEGLKTFGGMREIFNVRIVRSDRKSM